MEFDFDLAMKEAKKEPVKKEEPKTEYWTIEVTPINRRQLVDIMKFRKWVNLATGKLPNYYDDEEKIILKPVQVFILNRFRTRPNGKWGDGEEGDRIIEYVDLDMGKGRLTPSGYVCEDWKSYYWMAQLDRNRYARQKMAGTLKEEWVQKVKDAGGEEWTV